MNSFIKPVIYLSCMVALSCNSSNSGNSSNDTSATSKMADTSNAMVSNTPSNEQKFINYAVPGNTKEIIWLKAGIAKGQNKELKDHAKMMLKDHEQLDNTVKNYLSSRGSLTAPVVDTSNVVTLQMAKGKDWDKAWSDQMVNDHSDLLDKLKQSQKDVTDTALQTIINNTIPVVESHLKMAKGLQDKLK